MARTKRYRIKVKTWMTESIKESLRKRNDLLRQAKMTQDPSIWEEYHNLKNQINEEIRQSKLNNGRNFNRNTLWNQRPSFHSKSLPFSCDRCDRDFASQAELDSHCSLHIVCHYADCNFTAHPKIVELHQKMQHGNGYAEAINKLQNDEEIKKWREERKRRYPTAENILKKAAEQAEKEARGEVIEEKQYGQFKKRKFEDRKRGCSFDERNRIRAFKMRDQIFRKRGFQKVVSMDVLTSSNVNDSDSEEDCECHIKLPKFKGVNHVFEEPVADTSTDVKMEGFEEEDDAPLEVPIEKASLNQSFDEENTVTTAVKKNEEAVDDSTLENNTSGKTTTDEKPDENKETEASPNSRKNNRRERRKNKDPSAKPPQPRISWEQRNSLLRMLLSDEIRHERNVIMQCVRHIVRNNFFGIGADT